MTPTHKDAPELPIRAAQKRDDDRAPNLSPSSHWHQNPIPHKTRQSRARRAGLVLIADDTRGRARTLWAIPQSPRLRVQLASDGAVAVDAAIKLRPDVIVLDLSMPVLDGIAATLRLRAHPRTGSIPIILLTGYPYKAIAAGALEGGVDVFLTKPCCPKTWRATSDACWRGRAAGRTPERGSPSALPAARLISVPGLVPSQFTREVSACAVAAT